MLSTCGRLDYSDRLAEVGVITVGLGYFRVFVLQGFETAKVSCLRESRVRIELILY